MSACGSSGQASQNDFNGVVREIHFAMTKDDVIEMEYNISGMNYTAEEIYEGDTVLYYEEMKVNGYSGMLTYRIEETGTLGFLQFKFDADEDYDSFMEDFQKQYGEPSTTKDYYEVWYGVVEGEKVTFTASEDLSLIKVAKK